MVQKVSYYCAGLKVDNHCLSGAAAITDEIESRGPIIAEGAGITEQAEKIKPAPFILAGVIIFILGEVI